MALGDIVISEAEIARAIPRLAVRISEDYGDTDPIFVGVMDGAMCFLVDLIRSFPHSVDVATARVQSYSGTEPGKITVEWLPSQQSLEGRHVLLVEDIVDTGATLTALSQHVLDLGARSVKICSLLDKPSKRTHNLQVDFVGFEIPDVFVVGCGLDYNGAYRNLRDVRSLNPTGEKGRAPERAMSAWEGGLRE